MALFKDINSTYISYSGRSIDLRKSGVTKAVSKFVIDIHLEISFNHVASNRYLFTKYNQRMPIESTDDIRWILKKLYNE